MGGAAGQRGVLRYQERCSGAARSQLIEDMKKPPLRAASRGQRPSNKRFNKTRGYAP